MRRATSCALVERVGDMDDEWLGRREVDEAGVLPPLMQPESLQEGMRAKGG
jgi:chromosome condensin MukBEF complex kleisin-like MukF subunit